MNLYQEIVDMNKRALHKQAVSITLASHETMGYTYEQLFEKTDKYAALLKQQGIGKGERVVLVGENSPSWQMAFLAIMKIGATAVLIDASLTGEGIKELIIASEASGIYLSDKIKDKVVLGDFKDCSIFGLDQEGSLLQEAIDKDREAEKLALNDEEVAVIIYSSGTTRAAMGVMHTHEALIGTLQMITSELKLTKHDRILALLPNTHIYGVITCLLGPMLIGASVHYVASINNELILSAFRSFKPTIFPGVPKIFELFEKQIKKKIEATPLTRTMYKVFYPISFKLRKKTGINIGKLIFKSIHEGFGGKIRLMSSAGAPIKEETAQFYYGVGFDLLSTYGLTETNIPLIGGRGDNLVMDSCGKPYPNIEIKLNAPDDRGEGEICIRSPYIMKGYFNNEEETAACFDEEGWFKTGDLAQLDTEGNIKITGRSKENIVLATGKKVTPSAIEDHYMEIPGIEELVISGVPSTGDYDEVHAFVVKKGQHFEDSHILRAIQERGSKLSQYMKVAKVHFIEEIPKTSLQKPKRYLLKKYALERLLKKEQENKERSGNQLGEENLESALKKMVIELTGISKELVVPDAHLISEIGVDSLGAIELALKIEMVYKVNVEALMTGDPTLREMESFIKKGQEEGVVRDSKQPSIPLVVKSKKFYHYIIFKCAAVLAHILYRVQVKGADHIIQDKGYIICANHVSNIDYLWVAQCFNKKQFSKFCCMAKKELFTGSRTTQLLQHICGMIPVDRGGMNFEVMTLCKEKLHQKWGLLIHPEGTRSQMGEIGSFRKGAANIAKEADVCIIPVYIKGAHTIFPRGRKMPKLFDWEHKRRYKVEIIYGAPIQPQGLSVDELMAKVEEEVRRLAQ